MNTILTDDEIHKWWASENGMEDADMAKLNDFREVTRKVETAVLAKLREQEPLFLLHSGRIGSDGEQDDWETEADSGQRVDDFCRKHPEQTIALYPFAAPQPAVVQVPQDRERWLAVREGHFNAASAEYFNARPHLDTPENRRTFYAGHCKGYDAASEAPATAVVQVPQGWRLEVDESAIYHNDKRIAVLEEDGGNQSWRDACALGQQIVDRMNAAHEAPAQGSTFPVEPPRNIIWDSRHPDRPVEWSNPGRAARDGELHYIRYDLYSDAVHAATETPAQGVFRKDGKGHTEYEHGFNTGWNLAWSLHDDVCPATSEAKPIPAPWREAVKVAQWQPIKTAPRDGTNILLRWGSDGVSQGHYIPGIPRPWKFIDTNNGITWLINHSIDGIGGPSHWMPMPPAALAQLDSLGGGE